MHNVLTMHLSMIWSLSLVFFAQRLCQFNHHNVLCHDQDSESLCTGPFHIVSAVSLSCKSEHVKRYSSYQMKNKSYFLGMELTL